MLITNDLKVFNQVYNAASKANKIISMLIKTFAFLDLQSYRTLYCAFVRQQLEFAVSAWNSFLKKDILKLEKVQRRATKFAPGLRNIVVKRHLLLIDAVLCVLRFTCLLSVSAEH